MKKIILFLFFLQKSFNIEFNKEEINIFNEIYKSDMNENKINEMIELEKGSAEKEDRIFSIYKKKR
jgi:hypothetical protein